MIGEIKRYGISVPGIQESRWFGSDVWPAADGFTFLHSGRPLIRRMVKMQEEMKVWYILLTW